MRDFIVCGLPIRKTTALEYVRQNGAQTLRVIADPRHGLPYGIDRLFPIWLASAFMQAGMPADDQIRFRSVSDILRAFSRETDPGAPPASFGGRELGELRKRICRVSGARYQVDMREDNRLVSRNYRLIEAVDLSFLAGRHHDQRTLWDNWIALDHSFADDLRGSGGIPINLHVVRQLRDCESALDLYLWQAWRSWGLFRRSAKSDTKIPILGDGGLMAQLGSETKTEKKAREQIRRWQQLVKRAWPECPNELSADGEVLIVRAARAVAEGAQLHMPGVPRPGDRLPAAARHLANGARLVSMTEAAERLQLAAPPVPAS